MKQNTNKRKSPPKTCSKPKPETWVQDKLVVLHVQREWALILCRAIAVQNQLLEIEKHLQWLNKQVGGVGKFEIQFPKVVDLILELQEPILRLLRKQFLKRTRNLKDQKPKEAV